MRGWVCGLAMALAAPPAPAAELLSAQVILQRSVDAENADWNARKNYSFTQTEREDDGPAKTYEVTHIFGTPYRRLVAVDSVPLNRADQAAEQRKLAQEIAKRKAESSEQRAARIAKYRKSREQQRVMLLEMTKALNFRILGEDVRAGHPAWMLDAEPKPGYEPPNQRAKVLTGMRGKLWIAKEGYHWVRVEAEVVRPVYFEGFLARVGPGTRFELENAPAGNGVWLSSRFAVNVNAKIIGIFGHNSREEETFKNYRPEAGDGATVASRQ